MKKATFGAGCFWGVEASFRKINGVTDTAVGFMGGTIENPTYEQVSYENTGHAEVCQVEYDETKVSFDELLDVFWKIHDPTQLNRQGPDIGDQYRSVIFYHDDEQRITAETSKKKIKDAVTFIEPVTDFYKAEEYHQRYLEKTGKKTC